VWRCAIQKRPQQTGRHHRSSQRDGLCGLPLQVDQIDSGSYVEGTRKSLGYKADQSQGFQYQDAR
jgi:hypothetical protein